jgi:hypothetical protein
MVGNLSNSYISLPRCLGSTRVSGLEVACMSGVASLVLLLVAFASPYWLVSWEDTQSPFVRSVIYQSSCFSGLCQHLMAGQLGG